MNPFKKIAGYNILGILLYSIIVRLIYPRDSLSLVLSAAVLIGLHVLTSIIISLMYFSDGNKEYGRAWLGSAGIVLLVGFSACWGIASI